MAVKILVVDDHEVVHQGIQMILQSRPEWQIVGQANNGAEAIDMAQRLQPDAIIMDITMPVMNGLEATRQITKLGLASPVIIFTMHESQGLLESVQSAGGRGLVLKSRAAHDLVEALERIINGGTYFRSNNNHDDSARTVVAKKSESGYMRFQAIRLRLVSTPA
jgi:two-component system nitrate/nitrite response regulator NarL